MVPLTPVSSVAVLPQSPDEDKPVDQIASIML